MHSDPVLIHLTGISKVFLTDEIETRALDDVGLAIRQGEYVAIEGPSGCGKTTLLSLLGLLDTPTAGDYVLAGEPGRRPHRTQSCRTRPARAAPGSAGRA